MAFSRLMKGGFEEAWCKQACPAEIDVPRFIRAIRDGKFDEALGVIQEKIPFASVCGYICPRFCEAKCRRAEVDEPVAIDALKRFVAERGQISIESKTSKSTGKRVAIVGSGPSGLTAGYYLAKVCNRNVTVFEAQPKAGGMMLAGIPEFRLPKKILNAEIDLIKNVGVDIKTNSRIENVDYLFNEGFDAIFIAIGAWRSSKLGIEGENSPNVVDGLSFLHDVNTGKAFRVGERVAVIGGGNVAIDAARVARRLGAKDVYIIYRRSREEMPASPDEVDQALEEGVNIIFLVAPSKINKIKRKNETLHVEFIRMRLGGIGESRRRQQEQILGSEFVLDFDTVIAAIGERPDISPTFGIATAGDGRVRVDPVTLTTDRIGVFAGGDAITGPASVIEAISAGRKAAINIDKYLGGQGNIDEMLAAKKEIMGETWEESILELPRQRMPLLDSIKRISNFNVVELGFTPEMAKTEAERCLRCDQRLPIDVDLAKCIECYMCQTMCSFTYHHACNPEKGRLIFGAMTSQIHYGSDCIGGCSLCVKYCATGALSLGHINDMDICAIQQSLT